jgi:Domain of unknown function (DUF6265)
MVVDIVLFTGSGLIRYRSSMLPLLLLTTLVLPPHASPSIADVSWLAGCWSLSQGQRTVREHWMPADGGMMMAVSRTVSAGKTLEYEFVLIRESGSGLEFVAKPSRQAEAVFTSTKVASGEIVFENPKHDFPTRIAYTRVVSGLLATISGDIKGKPRTIEFRYSATDCVK